MDAARDGGAGARVGLVLVSHSAEVAASVARLAVALAGGTELAPVRAAGGTPDGGFGTDADAVAAAAREADEGAGVLLLTDLGSAVLTVKVLLAEDELPPGAELLDAPFVEGAVAALVTASGGAGRAEVAAAAREAYDYRKV
ncbi:PTS fructose transporter subunit IIA [Streptomyces sp. Z26]|uniref:PTS-dependent dihydroxyacetone kinase phosphotransferase subunit DhaM n=1 Tax=Streptomyces sp. Z26 TaxID=2500177 RepID=UPI0019D194C1|nr:PTS fructose transporter subunit IIA [Streptomyces sp. Z26]